MTRFYVNSVTFHSIVSEKLVVLNDYNDHKDKKLIVLIIATLHDRTIRTKRGFVCLLEEQVCSLIRTPVYDQDNDMFSLMHVPGNPEKLLEKFEIDPTFDIFRFFSSQ